MLRHGLELVEDRKYKKELLEKQGSYAEYLEELDAPLQGQTPVEFIQKYFMEHPEVLILYGDEDVCGADGIRRSPWFRPDWSPELLESQFYLGGLVAVRLDFALKTMQRFEKLSGKESPMTQALLTAKQSATKEPGMEARTQSAIFMVDGPDEEYMTDMRYLCEKAGGWERGCKSIVHLPLILHHCDSEEELEAFAGPYHMTDLYQTVEKKDPAEGYGREDGNYPFLSVIIPSKDNPELLGHCLQSLKKAAEGITYEVIVVDNGSSPENRQKISTFSDISYLYRPMEFDFAAMCNLGASAAGGKLLLFLNDDVELLEQSQLKQMKELALRPGVGSVGLKLYYPDSKRIQHAGITNLPMGPVHKLQFLEDSQEYYYGMNRGNRNVLAVSAACVMTETEKFQEAGGFEGTLKVAFNDVALGFKMYELGYRNVCMCDAYAYHHESLTRGGDDSREKLERLLNERKRLYELFPDLEGQDPYYSIHLGRQGLDTRVRPAYETRKNYWQKCRPEVFSTDGYREDACLMFRVEDERNGEITGYSVVLGDDNACYDRWLLIKTEKDSETVEAGNDMVYAFCLEGRYRPDLAENMPDQKNVALCGFRIRIPEDVYSTGRYLLGCAVKSRIGGTKLVSWSSRSLGRKV